MEIDKLKINFCWKDKDIFNEKCEKCLLAEHKDVIIGVDAKTRNLLVVLKNNNKYYYIIHIDSLIQYENKLKLKEYKLKEGIRNYPLRIHLKFYNDLDIDFNCDNSNIFFSKLNYPKDNYKELSINKIIKEIKKQYAS